MLPMHRHHSTSSTNSGNSKTLRHYSYQPSDRIGKGYSSVVYKGTNTLTQQTVAIKAIDMKGVKDNASREMLDCEIEALTKLKNENVLKCFDVFRQPSHCYIITQCCNQGDLSSLLKKKRRLSEKEALKITKDIVNGFIQIAECGFLHRDLKLANIFLEEGKAIIADFGFAKKHYGCFEREKYNVGSPLYMSPEALKKNVYTVKNDIWSIGIMVYELLHGETPWECRTEKELMDKMVRVPVKFRESLNLSSQIKQFIKKCLQVNQEARMSLSGLKEWNNDHPYSQIEQDKKQVPLRKVTSNQESGVVLSQLTNRMPSKSQSTVAVKSKVNSSKVNHGSLKGVFDKNNSILIIEINTFRLLFKIHQKLSKYYSQQKQLINTIGNEVLRRVTTLMSFLNPQKENTPSNTNNFSISQAQHYLSEETNSGIKKYRSVVKEYQKKYNNQISTKPLGRQVSVKSLIKEALEKGDLLTGESSQQELMMVYWMVQFSHMGNDVKKQWLEGVIQPKNNFITQNYLKDRIKAL